MSEIRRSLRTPIMHRVSIHGDLVFLGGVAADNLDGDMEQQAAEVFAKIEHLLNDCGSSKDHLLSATIYLSDFGQKGAMNRSWNAWLDEAALPCRATIGVADLGPSVLIEVVSTAALKGAA